ncbi:hypothetical protein AX16_003016 [Volvariella volvacea WC 439]|nr:hypothetical protein AX16_003016 [Volvariella volvacea WC 439]
MQSAMYASPALPPPTSPIPSSSPTPFSSSSMGSIGDAHGVGADAFGRAASATTVSVFSGTASLPTTPQRHTRTHAHNSHAHPTANASATPARIQPQTSGVTTPQHYAPVNSSPLASPRTPTQDDHDHVIGEGGGGGGGGGARRGGRNADTFERRRASYKSRASLGGGASDDRSRNPFLVRSSGTGSPLLHSGSSSGSGGGAGARLGGGIGTLSGSQGQKDFLRRQFQQKCLQHAARAREKAVQRKRVNVGKDRSVGSEGFSGSSDGFDEDMMAGEEEEDGEQEETVDDVMGAELFGRLLEHWDRQEKHQYRRSYALDVGSSFDPDMEDIDEWEQHLSGTDPSAATTTTSGPSGNNSQPKLKYNYRPKAQTAPTPTPTSTRRFSSLPSTSTPTSYSASLPSSVTTDPEEYEIPYDLDDLRPEELEACAKEYERQAALAEFADIPEEELFGGLSDLEDDDDGESEDDAMDVA